MSTKNLNHPAVAEYLAGNVKLAYTIAEDLARGASEASLADLVCALMAYDAVEALRFGSDSVEHHHLETVDCPEHERVWACMDRVKASMNSAGFIAPSGSLQ